MAAIVARVIEEDYPVPLDLSKTACGSVAELFASGRRRPGPARRLRRSPRRRYVVLTFESRALSEALDEEIATVGEDGQVVARADAADDTPEGKPPPMVDLLKMLQGVGRAPEVKRRNRVCVPLVDLFDGAPTGALLESLFLARGDVDVAGKHNATTQRNLLDETPVITMTTTARIAPGKDIFNAYGPNGGATMLFKCVFFFPL